MALFTNKLKSIINKVNPLVLARLQVRPSSYNSSPYLEDLAPPATKYQVTQIPEEWKHVENILPPALVPVPPMKETPSGWKPQTADVNSQPYFITRTKNHMIPVYLAISQNGVTRRTIVKGIKGDIWLLEKEIKEFLQKESIKPIRSQVNEFTCIIRIHGDHVNAIKYWLEQRKF